jgi:hypothetical protein
MKLIANTPVGIFKRTTDTAYQYVVVRSSPRAKEAFDKFQTMGNYPSLATEKRWVRDNGFAVTWHGSKQSADKSALGSYSWDKSANLVGVYQVEGN